LVDELVAPPRVPEKAELARQIRARKKTTQDMACDNFGAKEAKGIDTDVFEDFLAWTTARAANVTFFVPPLNRHALAACPGPALARLDAAIAELQARGRAHNVEVLDLSHGLEEQSDSFRDYGHMADSAYDQWLAPLAERLEGPPG